MSRGLTSVRYHTTNLKRATRWYAELLGIEPHREQPEYVEFRPGDHHTSWACSTQVRAKREPA
jgi:catechol 2,3-dioxygenase-like lactoylglutathione lyase family enzyme